MKELIVSGIKLAYIPAHNYFFEISEVTEKLKVHRSRVNYPSRKKCLNWARYQKNVIILLSVIVAEIYYASGFFIGKNS
jgi:hypothetical protein